MPIEYFGNIDSAPTADIPTVIVCHNGDASDKLELWLDANDLNHGNFKDKSHKTALIT